MRKSSVYFEEEQRLDSVPLRITMGTLYIGVLFLLSYGYYFQFVLGQTLGKKPMSNEAYILLCVFIVVILFVSAYLVFSTRLIVKVTKTGIFYRYPPVQPKEKCLLKKEILSWKLRTYKPLQEYGGWGARQGVTKLNKANNVRGNIGMQLELAAGKKLLFGTERGSAFVRAMGRMMKEG